MFGTEEKRPNRSQLTCVDIGASLLSLLSFHLMLLFPPVHIGHMLHKNACHEPTIFIDVCGDGKFVLKGGGVIILT